MNVVADEHDHEIGETSAHPSVSSAWSRWPRPASGPQASQRAAATAPSAARDERQ